MNKNEMVNFNNLSDEELELMHKQTTTVQINRLQNKIGQLEIGYHKTNEQLGELKKDVNERMTIDYGQQQAILNAKKARVEKLWRTGQVNEDIHDTKRKVHGAAGKALKDAFGVSSYRDIRQKDFEDALAFVKSWRPRMV